MRRRTPEVLVSQSRLRGKPDAGVRRLEREAEREEAEEDGPEDGWPVFFARLRQSDDVEKGAGKGPKRVVFRPTTPSFYSGK